MWDTTQYRFPKNSDPLPLTQGDLELVDSLFKSRIQEYNEEQKRLLPKLYEMFPKEFHKPEYFLIDLKDYKKQFFPYQDVNGQKVVFIKLLLR